MQSKKSANLFDASHYLKFLVTLLCFPMLLQACFSSNYWNKNLIWISRKKGIGHMYGVDLSRLPFFSWIYKGCVVQSPIIWKISLPLKAPTLRNVSLNYLPTGKKTNVIQSFSSRTVKHCATDKVKLFHNVQLYLWDFFGVSLCFCSKRYINLKAFHSSPPAQLVHTAGYLTADFKADVHNWQLSAALIRLW